VLVGPALGRTDLRSGGDRVRPGPPQLEVDDDEAQDDSRWMSVPCQGSRDGYRDMEVFAARTGDAGLGGRLERALTGRDVLRWFRDVLAESPRQLQGWYAFKDERHRCRAPNWFASEGYRPMP